LLFYLLFRKVDFGQFMEALRNARLDYIGAGFLILWIGHTLCLFRWRMLLGLLIPVFSLARLFMIYCIGLFFNLAFPTAVGGDAVKMYYAGKHGESYAPSFAATFLDRDLGMLAMMIIACTGTIIHPFDLPGIPVVLIVWLSFLGFILVNIGIFTPRLHGLLIGVLCHVRLQPIAEKIGRISDAFTLLGAHRSVLAGSLIISLINQLLVVTTIWIFARGLHIEVSFLYFPIFVPIITLISMIPVSLNGMGLREYAFMSLFGALGVPVASCVALGMLSTALIVASAIPGGIAYMFFGEKVDMDRIAALETDAS